MAGEGGIAATVMTPDGTWSGAAGTADGVDDLAGRQPVRHRQRHEVDHRGAGDAARGGGRDLARRTRHRLPPCRLHLRHQRRDDPPAPEPSLRDPGLVRRRHGGAHGGGQESRLGRSTRSSRSFRRTRRPVDALRVRGHQLQPARARHRTRSQATARRRAARWRPPRRRDGAAHLPARRGPDRPDGHAARRVARRARAGRRLPSIDLGCELRRSCGRHRVRFDLARTLVAGVLRRRDRLGGVADRDVDVLRRRLRLRARAVQSRGRVHAGRGAPRCELRLQVVGRVPDRGPAWSSSC